MSRLLLRREDPTPTDLSHFHRLVSAYHISEELVEALAVSLEEAQKEARQSGESIIVEQDCLEHLFIVFPSGNVGLYRSVGTYQIVERAATP